MSSLRHPGLIPAFRGFYIGECFATPGYFALAHIGLTSPKELKQVLSTRADGVTLDDLISIAEERWGTSEIIEGIPIKNPGTISLKDTYSVDVTSQKGNTHKITLYNPYEDSLGNLSVQGGTTFHQKMLARNTHVSSGLAHDRRFRKHMARFQEFKNTYGTQTKILDYTHACALTFLAQNPGLVRGRDSSRRIIVPFNFQRNPNVAIDVLLDLEQHTQRYAEMNVIGEKIVPKEFGALYKKGNVRKGIFIDGKRWHPTATPLLHAFEEHAHEIERTFTGQYTLEFPNSSKWTSLVFQGPRMNVHIIYDENLPEPLIIYKYPTQEELTPVLNPFDYINEPSADKSVRKGKKHWVEDDFWSGKRMACYMFMPNEKIHDAAKKFK